jgi:hypothetical protein
MIMNRYALLIGLVSFSLNSFAEDKKKIYKYTDENGVTHYTETKPNENYEEADLPQLSIVPSAPIKSTSTSVDNSVTDDKDSTEVTEFEILAPNNEQNLWGTGLKLTAKVTPLTAAQQELYQVQFVIDGKKQQASDQTTQVFENIYRGEHKIQALLVNKYTRKEVKKSKPVTFYMHQSTKK